MKNNEIKNRFNELRKKYGNILIKLKKQKIPENKWYDYISKEFNEKEISFLFGQNIWEFVNKKRRNNLILDLDKGTKVKIKNNSSKLIISPEKAGIITWICTDGYMSLHRGYYISIKDDDALVFNHFKNIIKDIYGKVHFGINKVKNKNAFQCRFCSKDIFRDLITYIPLSFSKNWTIPIELLDKNATKEALKILTHTEGSAFLSNRRRAIEITLANFEVLAQAKALFDKLNIETSKIRKDFSGGWERYKFSIGGKNNLERFRKEIHFIPNTKKYKKFEKIMDSYKEYHRTNKENINILLSSIRKHPLSNTEELSKLSNLYRTTVQRNLKKLRGTGKIDYVKGRGLEKKWKIII